MPQILKKPIYAKKNVFLAVMKNKYANLEMFFVLVIT